MRFASLSHNMHRVPIPSCRQQVATEGGEEVDKRALLDRLRCEAATEKTSEGDRNNPDFMVEKGVRSRSIRPVQSV